MDYEADLQALKEAQKKKAIADLETQKQQSLSNLNAEESQVKPTYYKKKDTANVQSQIAGKNFAEYLVNTGRSNSGIGAQAELSRQNNLQRSLNDLNTEEAGVLADIARRKTDVNNAYESGLASANAQIEADYITNLLNQRQQQWEREFQEKQFEYQKQQDALNRAYSRSSSSSSSSSKTNTLEWKPNNAYTATQTGNYITYTDKSNSNNKMTVPIGYNPFTGTYNPDVANGAFGNGYQPDNVNGVKLKKNGSTTWNGQKQSIWSDGKNDYVWDGRTNEYVLIV